MCKMGKIVFGRIGSYSFPENATSSVASTAASPQATNSSQPSVNASSDQIIMRRILMKDLGDFPNVSRLTSCCVQVDL
jgi:hypothetical protein